MYKLRGKIIHGKGNGRKVGMPTANLDYGSEQGLPKQGVYGVIATVDQVSYIGVTNVGTRPSVDDDSHITVETYIPELDMDLYGKEMEVEFHLFLRGVKKFASLEEVRQQVEEDICRLRAYSLSEGDTDDEEDQKEKKRKKME